MGNQYLQEVTELIEKQQGGRGPVWLCGKQLLEMIAADEAACKLVLDDLKHGGLTLKGCEGEIWKFACKNGSCCTGPEAETVIRKYFGLPDKGQQPDPVPAPEEPTADTVNLEDFFG